MSTPEMELYFANDVVREAQNAWYGQRLQEARADGLTQEQIDSEAFVSGLNEGFMKFAFENMGPGTETNLDADTIARALRINGYELPEAPLGPRDESIRVAAQQVAEAKQAREKLAEDAAAAYKKASGPGEMLYASQAFNAVTTDLDIMREIPSRVGAAIKTIEYIPIPSMAFTPGKIPNPAFDPRAAENYGTVQEAIRYRIPGYDLPGVDSLTDLGVPHWMADILVEDVLDPVSWLYGSPLLVAGAKGSVKAASKIGRFGTQASVNAWLTARAMRSALRSGERVTGDELFRTLMAPVRAREEDLAGVPLQPLLSRKDIRDFADVAEGQGRKDAAAAFREFADKLGAKKWRESNDETYTRLIKDALDRGENDTAEALMIARLGVAQDANEIAGIQTMFQRVLGDKVDLSLVRRGDVIEHFVDVANGRVVAVEGGVISQFAKNPNDFLISTSSGLRWANTPQAQAAKRILGLDPNSARATLSNLVPMGHGREFQQAVEGVETILRNSPIEARDFLGPLNKVSPMAQRLQRTPVFRSWIMADGARNQEKAAWTLMLHDALGGKVNHLGNRLVEILFSEGGSGFKIKDRSPIIARRSSLWNPRSWRELKTGFASTEARDLNDKLVYLLGDDLHKSALVSKRAEDGLAPLKKSDFTQEDIEMAQRVRRLFNRLGDEAVRLGLLDPESMLRNYLPRLRRQTGATWQDLIRRARSGDPIAGREADAFFSMARKSDDPGDMMLNLAEMYESYVDALTRHKYVRPMVKNTLDYLLSPSTSLGRRDVESMLDWLHHQLGGTTRLQATVANMREHFDGLVNVMGERLVPDTTWEYIQKGGEWFTRQFADIAYTHFIGAKAGLGFRNLTQQALGVPMMGGKNAGWKHLTRGIARMQSDDSLYKAYLERAKLWNWHSEWHEVATNSMDNFANMWPGLLSERYKRILMGWYQLTDMQNRVNVWGGGYDYAEDVVRKFVAGKKQNWKNSAAGFTAEERATLEALLKNGEYDKFKLMYADSTVNNSQWLYNRKNRPLFLQKHNPINNVSFIFLTWPMNFGSVMARAMTSGRPMSWNKAPLEIMKGGMNYLAPSVAMAYAAEYTGRAFGMAGAGSWLLPELEDFGDPGRVVKERMGLDSETDVLVPLPIKPLMAAGRTLMGDEPVESMFPIIRSWWDTTAAIESVFLSPLSETQAEKRGRTLQRAFRTTPALPQGLTALTSRAGEAMGIDENPDFRDGILEQVLGALLQVQENESLAEDIIKTQGFGQQGKDIQLMFIEKTK